MITNNIKDTTNLSPTQSQSHIVNISNIAGSNHESEDEETQEKQAFLR